MNAEGDGSAVPPRDRARHRMALFVRIDRTWTGRRLPPDRIAEIGLETAGESLLVTVDAPFHGDPPPPPPPGPTPGLWRHEVIELFIAGEGDADVVQYLEVELSPHGHHLVLRLRGVRQVVAAGQPLQYEAAVRGSRWHGQARIPRAWLPPPPHRLAAFAVHGSGASRRHLSSLALPGERPDFHQPARFPRLHLP